MKSIKNLFFFIFFSINFSAAQNIEIKQFKESFNNAINFLEIDSLKTVNDIKEISKNLINIKTHSKEQISLLLDIADFYLSQLYEFKESDAILAKAILYSKEINFKKGEAKAIFMSGVSHSYKSDFEKAGKLYLQALPLFESIKDTLNIILTIRNMGYTYSELSASDLSDKYLKRAAFLADKSNNFLQKIEITTGIILKQLENNTTTNVLQKLIEIEKDTEKLSIENHEILHLKARIYSLYSFYYLQVGNPKLALNYSEKAYLSHKQNEFKDYYHLCASLQELVKANIALGKLKNAEKYCLEGVSIAMKYGFLKRELFFTEKLYSIKNYSSNLQKKVALAERIMELKDALYNEFTIKKINILTKNYESEKKDKEIAEQKLLIQNNNIELIKNKSQKRIFIIITILFILVLFTVYFYFIQRQKLKDIEIEKIKTKTNLERLQSVMYGEEKERKRISEELHDGINGDLTALKYQISNLYFNESEVDIKNALKQKIIPKLNAQIAQIRSLSHFLTPSVLLENTLGNALYNYCNNLNKSTSVEISFQVLGKEKQLDIIYRVSIYRVVQELITNSLKHAQAKEILVNLNYQEKSLEVIVEDDGIGFNVNSFKKGLGHRNIQSRLQVLQATHSLISDINGTNFTIKIDYDKLSAYKPIHVF